MNLINRLFHIKATPEKTVVPDELVMHYPEPPEVLQTILQKVPGTGIVLYQYMRRFGITKESKYWAIDMMDRGMETPGIIQLAGEDLHMNPFAYEDLLNTIFRELAVVVEPEVSYCAYAISIAQQVLKGERTAESGFELLTQIAIETDYHPVFFPFYLWYYNADEVADCPVAGSGLRVDNVEEWMYQYFEKFVKANPKYGS